MKGKTMNPARYRDETNKIEYTFVNFAQPLTEEKMKELSAKHGRPRKGKSGKQTFEKNGLSLTVEWGETWEFQVIFRQPEYPQKMTPEEILAWDLGCRMIATD